MILPLFWPRRATERIWAATLKFILILGLLCGSASIVPHTPVYAAPGAIKGNVFRDINNDGQRSVDNIEPGIAGIQIFVYDSNNSLVNGTGPGGAWVTNANGDYTISGLPANRDYRLEFRTPSALSNYRPGPVGPNSASTVVFARTGDEDVDASFHLPAEYCQENPDTITSCFVFDAYDSETSEEPALITVPYNASGNDRDQASKIAVHRQVGTVYGLAYQRTTQRIYAAAYQKRFTGFGEGGPDAIYQLDTSGNTITHFNLSAIPGGASAGVDPHNFAEVPNSGGEKLDIESYDKVGTISFGDLEISDDMTTLYVVNLFDRKIYAIDVSTGNVNDASVVNSWDAPDACSGAEHRPFGLGWNNGRLYVGSVCEDASNAYIHSIDPDQGGFRLEVTVPLGYSREKVADASVEPGAPAPAPQPDDPDADWRAWSYDPSNFDITYVGKITTSASSPYNIEIAWPQPMLSDIEFDNGSLILGFRDRFGDQTGYQALHLENSLQFYSGVTAGDILRVCRVNNSWVLETGDSGACSAQEGAQGARQNSGPNGEEYYYWDFFGRNSLTQDVSPDSDQNYHFEITGGGLLQLPGKETVLTTALDPFEFSSAGYLRLDNRTGQRQGVDIGDIASPTELETGGYTIFVSDATSPTFGKANGLGDIEAICAPPPIQIGNRVWSDGNGNGIQDAGESPIAGVAVGLYNSNGSLITSAITDNKGTYYFSSGSGSSTASAKYGLNLLPGATYTVGLLDTNFAVSSVLEGYVLTIANASSGTDSDARDSDGASLPATVGAASTSSSFGVTVNTGVAGDNNHSYDFGLVQMDFGDLPENGTSFPVTGPTGASHQIVTNVYLGGGVDRDADGQPSIAANGDDNDSNDDEDGVTFVTPLQPGKNARIEVDANVAGYLNAWIDFNGNGAFSADEKIADDRALTQGINGLTVSVPADATGVMYSRFRFTSDNPNGDLGQSHRWNNGEVEDYILSELGDRVWLDNGAGAGGAAADGIQNGSEPGVAAVRVELIDGDGNPVRDINGTPVSTTTDSTGLYHFPGLAPGDYQVKFTPPTGLGFTLQNVGNEVNDSDANVSTGLSDVVTLAPNEINPNVDAGLIPLLSLGDLVWNDVNNNGRVDGGENGISGVKVNLWTVDSTGSPLKSIASQTTTGDGLYLFTGLTEGGYIVQIDSANFGGSGALTGYANSTGNGIPAPDPDDNVNNDDNGDQAGGLGVLSQPITLSNMGEPTNDGDSDNTSNLTVDFGFFLTSAAVDIEKATNGEDADTGPGPLVGVGSQVVWTYVVRNTGAVALGDVVVTDNIASVNPVYVSGDTNGDDILQVTEVWTYRATGTAIKGQYENISRVEGDPVDEDGEPIIGINGQPLPPVTDEDPSHYFGLLPAIDLEKATNGPGQQPQDADFPTGPGIPAGEQVTWTYVVQNTGNVALADVQITDDLEGAICTILVLAIGASDTCTATGTAVIGQYANEGTVTGNPVDEDGEPIPGPDGQPLPPVTDTDPSHYFGNGPAAIDIEKATNGEDADLPTGPRIELNGQVIWTYVVRNIGEFALANVRVTDNIPGVVPTHVSGDTNNDQVLQVSEVWTYEATGVATLGQYANIGSTRGDPVNEDGTPAVDLDGSPLPSPQDSDPSHYVGIAEAAIDLQKTVYVGHDNGAGCPGQELVRDKSGTEVTYCFTITNTGSTYLTEIQLVDNDLGISLANMDLLSGNAEVLAPNGLLVYYYETTLTKNLVNTARTTGTPSDEDGTPIPSLEDVTDSDIAEVQILAAIGDYVWLDTNANGVQDPVEVGLPGINVTLYDEDYLVVDTTMTDEQGYYLFDGLEAGIYSVGFELPTADHFFSPQDEATDDTSDSDADQGTGRTEPTELIAGETDLTWDAGIYTPPQLVIEKTANAVTVQPNQRIVYTFSYRNDGLTDATGVQVIERVPEHVEVDLAASAPGWGCEENRTLGREICSFDVGTVKAKSAGTADLSFVVIADAFLPTTITFINNVVVIQDDGTKGQQPGGANTDEHKVDVEQPTALENRGEPSRFGPFIFLPLFSR